MSWAEEQILEGVIKKKLVLSSFYGQEKAGSIKAIIKDTENGDYVEKNNLPYGKYVDTAYDMPVIPIGATYHENIVYIFNGYEVYKWENEKWTKLALPPFSLNIWTAIVDVDDELRCFDFNTNKYYKYYINNNTWELIGNTSVSFSKSSVTAVRFFPYPYLNNTFLIGTAGSGATTWDYNNDPWYLYDAVNDTWTNIKQANQFSNQSGSQNNIAFDNKYIYTWNMPYSTNGGDPTRSSRFDPDSNQWSAPSAGSPTFRWVLPLVRKSIADVNSFIAMYATNMYRFNYDGTKLVATAIRKTPISLATINSKWLLTDDGNTHLISTTNNKHYIMKYEDLLDFNKWWISPPEEGLPYDYSHGSAVVFNNKIYLLGNSLTIPTQKLDKKSNKFLEYSGVDWEELTEIVYDFYNGSAVVYNDEIHLLGGSDSMTNHYKWHEQQSISRVSTIPYNFKDGCAVVYNNEIHILGGTGNNTYHYKWNGSQWLSVSTLPFNFKNGSAVVYNNEIHILGSSDSGSYTHHYKWNGTSWSPDILLPYNFYDGEALIWNDELHIIGGSGGSTNHYKLPIDGTVWTSVGQLPISFKSGSAVIYDGEMYIFGTDDTSTYPSDKNFMYRFDGENWVPGISNGGLLSNSAVLFDNQIHILGGYDGDDNNKHYAYDDTTDTWNEVSTLPYSFVEGCAEVFDNSVQILGGLNSPTSHYKYENGVWAEVSTLPYDFISGCSVILNNELHILGSSIYESSKLHYKWDGLQWIECETLPYSFISGIAFVHQNKIHVIGGIGGSRKHCVLSDGEWKYLSDVGESVINASGVMFNNEIHIFNKLNHSKLIDNITYMLNGSRLPKTFDKGSAITKDDSIHLLGGGSNKHYKFYDPGVKPVKLEDVEIYFY